MFVCVCVFEREKIVVGPKIQKEEVKMNKCLLVKLRYKHSTNNSKKIKYPLLAQRPSSLRTCSIGRMRTPWVFCNQKHKTIWSSQRKNNFKSTEMFIREKLEKNNQSHAIGAILKAQRITVAVAYFPLMVCGHGDSGQFPPTPPSLLGSGWCNCIWKMDSLGREK